MADNVPESLDSLPPGEEATSRTELIEQLFRKHNATLVSFLISRLRSEAEAHEVAQEAYVRMLQLGEPGFVSFHRAYLFKIAANLAVDRLRQRTVHRNATAREVFAEWLAAPGVDRKVLAEEEVLALQSALAELPEKAQEVFQRHFFGGETLQAIAKQVGLTDRMVRYHLARALAHCRQRLGIEERKS